MLIVGSVADCERCAFTDCAGDVDAAVVVFDDAAGQREAQAGAVAFCGVERAEDGNGKERWRKKVADEKLQYFTTMAPMAVKNHIIVGVGGDAMDVRGYLDAYDPETGERQWRWWSEPEKPGDPGSDTWPNPTCAHP